MISCELIAEPLVGEPIGIPDPPILTPFVIVAYAIAANFFYTDGWKTELMLARIWDRPRASSFAVRAFRIGVKFSVALTIFPALLCWGGLLYGLATGHRITPGQR